jgi:hypothetical protein
VVTPAHFSGAVKTRLALAASDIADRSIASMRLVRPISTCLIQNINPSSGVGS